MTNFTKNSPSIPSHISLQVSHFIGCKYERDWRKPPIFSFTKTKLDIKHTYFLVFGHYQSKERDFFLKSFRGNILYTCKSLNHGHGMNHFNTLVVFEVEQEKAPWGKVE